MAVAGVANTLVRQLKLNTGATIPILGLGTWLIQGGEMKIAIKRGIEIGFRNIDGAQMYNNEIITGYCLKECFDEGLCKREDIFLTSKLAPYSMFPSKFPKALEKTLSELRTNYLDLYLIHWPHRLLGQPKYPGDYSHIETYEKNWMGELWACLESRVKDGTIRAIGVSNFTINQIDNLLETCKIPPAVNQVESHIFLQQRVMKMYLDSKGIILQAYSTLGSAKRNSFSRFDPNVLKNPVLLRIAEEHGVTAPQVALSFMMEGDMAVLCKSVDVSRLEENFKSLNLKLTEHNLRDLRTVNTNYRLINARFLIPHSLHVDFWGREYEKNYEKKLYIKEE